MSVAIAAIGISSLFVFAGPANALDWIFRFSYDNGRTASGTFTTNEVAHVVGLTYTIGNIAGSHNGLAIVELLVMAGQPKRSSGTVKVFNPILLVLGILSNPAHF